MTTTPPKKAKGWTAILLFIIPYFLVVGVLQVAGALIAGVDILDSGYSENTREAAIISFFDVIGTLLVIGIFVLIINKESWLDFGFGLKGRATDLWVGLVAGFVIMAAAFLLLLAAGEIRYSSVYLDLADLTYLFLLFVFVAVSEEALCRGFILGNLMESMDKYWALIISSVIFSLLHYFNPNINSLSLFNLFLAGIVLGLPYIYTRNLWLPISLHFSWNFFQSLFGFQVSGLELYTLINFTLPEETLLNGGDFGFEGSVLCTAAELGTILFLLWYLKKQNVFNNRPA